MKYNENFKLIINDEIKLRFFKKIFKLDTKEKYDEFYKNKFNDEFNDYYDINGNLDGCWIWIGAKDSRNHGIFQCKQIDTILASRIMYELMCNKIPENGMIKHKCGNNICVNFRHLYVLVKKVHILDDNTRINNLEFKLGKLSRKIHK